MTPREEEDIIRDPHSFSLEPFTHLWGVHDLCRKLGIKVTRVPTTGSTLIARVVWVISRTSSMPTEHDQTSGALIQVERGHYSLGQYYLLVRRDARCTRVITCMTGHHWLEARTALILLVRKAVLIELIPITQSRRFDKAEATHGRIFKALPEVEHSPFSLHLI